MNSVFCRYPSLEPAVIQEVIEVFRDGNHIDMRRVHKALQEMCPASNHGIDTMQHDSEQVQQPVVDVTTPGSPRPISPDVPPSYADAQAGPSGVVGNDSSGGHPGFASAATQLYDVHTPSGVLL
jgi:hypothetical protein